MSTAERSVAWNTAGRAYFEELNKRLRVVYTGEGDEVDLDLEDPRTEAQGEQVIREVIELNRLGHAAKARELFDPAYAPVFPWIKRNQHQAAFVTILGPDELLVRRGAAWQGDAAMFHLRGGEAMPVIGVMGACRSRNRDHLVLARPSGLEIRDARAGLGGTPVATIPWPEPSILRPTGMTQEQEDTWEEPSWPLQVEQLEVSDDGMRIAVSCYRQGILLASRHRGEPTWQRLLPQAQLAFHDDPGFAPSAGDMTHVAISRDGTRLAWGNQSSPHFLGEVGPGGQVAHYATVGNASEYPHYACFSGDGDVVALNSCHFYNGATVAFAWPGNRGKELAAYEEHEEAPVIENSLRVYAACWLPKDVANAIVGRETEHPGMFALAGSGLLRIQLATGPLGSAQGFGSSASSIDFCPESKRLALGSYSGFVHLYDPYEEELPGRIDGFRPRRELVRWALWKDLPHGPIRW